MDSTRPEPRLHPSLRDVADGAARLEDELLAERLENAGAAWLRGGDAPSLTDLLSTIPILRSRPVALDASIDLALRGLIGRGMSLDDAAAELRRQAPELSDAIDAHLALRSMLGSMPAAGASGTIFAEDLPKPFGETLKDGRCRYQLEELIGSGAEGTVYRAMDRLLSADGRPLSVAVKLLHTWRDGAGQSVSDEAARATRVRHPSIAGLLAYGSSEALPYIVYDYVDALPLDRWKSRMAQVPERTAAKLVAQLAEAVQVAHNAGVVHRDLKPSNVLVDKGGTPHITDFGLAAAMSRRSAAEPVGSLGFAAPEQLRASQGAEDALVDVYSLGGLLYWLLTGAFPNGDSPDAVRARLHDRGGFAIADPRDRRADLDSTLAAICMKALAPEPGDRHASAAVLEIDLNRWLAHEPVLPFDQHPVRRVRLWAKRSPAAVVGTALAALAVAGALGMFWRADLVRREAAFEIERAALAHELEIAEVRASEQEAKIDSARALFGAFRTTYEELEGDAANLAWLPALTATEALAGPLGLMGSELYNDIDESRVHVVENVLKEADSLGTRDSVEMTIWETALGFYLLKVGRPDQAQAVLAENRARAARVFPEGDPWHLNISALSDIALILIDPDPQRDADARDRLESNMDKLPAQVARMAEKTLQEPASQSRFRH